MDKDLNGIDEMDGNGMEGMEGDEGTSLISFKR